MSRPTTRRIFLMRSAAAGTGLWAAAQDGPAFGRAPGGPSESKVRIAIVGVGGMGGSHVNDAVVKAQEVVALCDVDEKTLDKATKVHPRAQTFHDFRRMFDAMGRQIDAVICATPDHTHAVVTARALREGKHVYTQKPLTHTVYESHVIAALAAKNPELVTQMGNQGHASEWTREVVELIRAGVIGSVREVHAWTNRPIWPQSIDRPEGSQPVPRHVHWDLWIGPMPMRPYHERTYHPFNWRGWWDFGTGALGDMACHILDPAFWALDLRHPGTIEAHAEGVKRETGPKWSRITYEFPARGALPPVKLTWYDGGQFPPGELIRGLKPIERPKDDRSTTGATTKDRRGEERSATGYVSNGSLFVGEKGTLYLGHGGRDRRYVLLPEKDFEGFRPPPKTIPRAPGNDHMRDWIEGIRDGRQAGSDFGYATAMTGMVLLGNLALRAGKTIRWDAERMCDTNAPEVEELINPPYRKGWEL